MSDSPTPAAGIFDRIIDSWAAKDDEVTVAVPVDGDEGDQVVSLQFRVLSDRRDIREMQRAAASFASGATPETTPIEAHKEYYDTDDETKKTAHILGRSCLTPGVTVIDFLRLAKQCGKIFDMIASQYETLSLGSVAKTEKEKIESVKNSLSATSSSETG